LRIVILTYESLYANMMTDHLIRSRPGDVVGIVRSDCLLYGKSLPGALWFLLRRTGMRFVGRKAFEFFQQRSMAILFQLMGRELRVPSLRQVERKYGVPVVGSKDVNGVETLAQIEDWRPDLVISVYLNQLIKRELIALPTKGCLNIHPALLPHNRGLFPYFWVLANGDRETGVTLHWVDEHFDTGEILLQAVVQVEPGDTITSLSYKSGVVGAEMLERGVALVAAGSPPHIQQDNSQSSYHSWPSLSDQKRFRQQGGSYGTIFDLMKYM